MTVPLFGIESDIPSTETGVEPVKDYSVPVTVTGEHLREIEKKKSHRILINQIQVLE